MTPVLALGDDVGFILGSYIASFAVIGTFAWWVIRSGKRMSEQVDDEHKYWT